MPRRRRVFAVTLAGSDEELPLFGPIYAAAVLVSVAFTEEPASEARPIPNAWPVAVGVLVPVALRDTVFAVTVVPSPMCASTEPVDVDSASRSVTEMPRLPESPVASPSGFSFSVAVMFSAPPSSMSSNAPTEVSTAWFTVACAEAPPPPAIPLMLMKCTCACGASVWLFAVIVSDAAFTVALLPTVAFVPPPSTAVALRMLIERPRLPDAEAASAVTVSCEFAVTVTARPGSSMSAPLPIDARTTASPVISASTDRSASEPSPAMLSADEVAVAEFVPSASTVTPVAFVTVAPIDAVVPPPTSAVGRLTPPAMPRPPFGGVGTRRSRCCARSR